MQLLLIKYIINKYENKKLVHIANSKLQIEHKIVLQFFVHLAGGFQYEQCSVLFGGTPLGGIGSTREGASGTGGV